MTPNYIFFLIIWPPIFNVFKCIYPRTILKKKKNYVALIPDQGHDRFECLMQNMLKSVHLRNHLIDF